MLIFEAGSEQFCVSHMQQPGGVIGRTLEGEELNFHGSSQNNLGGKHQEIQVLSGLATKQFIILHDQGPRSEWLQARQRPAAQDVIVGPGSFRLPALLYSVSASFPASFPNDWWMAASSNEFYIWPHLCLDGEHKREIIPTDHDI